MGAGRKTSTYDVDTSVGPSLRSFEERQRNLGSQLYGCIFAPTSNTGLRRAGCNHETFQECVQGLIFGLPRPHWCYVQYIQAGLYAWCSMPIFLFNYSNRKLHGIFKAESDGTWELNPQGWCKPGQAYTLYPCQVKVSVFLECNPLDEKDYRDIIRHCFLDDGHLRFELRKPEAQNLCRLFERNSAGYNPNAPATRPTPSIATQRPAASRAAANTTPAAASPSRPFVPGADFVEEEKPGKKKSGTFKPAAEPTTKAWSQAAKAPDKDLTSRASESSETSKHATQNGESSMQAAQQAQEAAWQTLTRKKAPEEQAVSPKAATPVQNGGQADGADSGGFNGPDYDADAARTIKPTQIPPQTTENELNELHTAMALLDVGAADAVWTAFYNLHSRLDAAQQERATISQIAEQLRASNEKLTSEVASVKHNMQLVMKQMRQLAGGSASTAPTANGSHALEAVGPSENGTSTQGQTVFLLGGNDGKDWLLTGDTFTAHNNTWHGGAVNLPYKNGYGATAALGRSIYLMGGGQGGETWFSTVLRYDADDQKWFECGAMREVRGSLGAAALHGKLYACGGGQPGHNLASVEVLDPEINTWMGVKMMSQARFSTTASSINGAVYVVGGFNGEAYLKSAEMLDPRTGRWQQLPEMSTKRGSSASAVLGWDLVAVGGFDGTVFHETVEAYDTRAGKWRMLGSMVDPRAYGCVENLDGKLYAMGGMCSAELGNNSVVECYNTGSDTWDRQFYTAVGSADPHALNMSFAASCVLDPL